MMRADLTALPASDAGAPIKQKLALRRLTLGIVTPTATEIAPLEEHGSANSGTVDIRAPLDIENGGGHRIHTSYGMNDGYEKRIA